MATVISSNELEAHNVNKYNFKVIANSGSQENMNQEEGSITLEKTAQTKIQEVDSSALSTSSKESLIESLMQKTDEMSSNFIKLQMKLEAKEEEFTQNLTKAKEEAFSEGLEAGVAKAQEDLDKSTTQGLEHFTDSVVKLEKSAQEFTSALEGIKSQLVSAALDIAQEVIKIELSSHSNEVAKLLCDELLKDLQTASKVTIKVNPINHGAISEHTGKLENVVIISDSAISEGGVIVISDAGNIDSQIQKRFERVKRAALSE